MTIKTTVLTVKVLPNSSKNAIVGFQGEVLKVKIKAPPDKGKANEELIEFLAESLGIAKSRIRIVHGQASRLKKVEITGECPITF